jgi:hypothetical protein
MTVATRRKKNPTVSKPKVVGSPPETNRFLRSFLAGVLRFTRRKRLWPEVEGHLSSWILLMHGLREKKMEGQPLESYYSIDVFPAVVDFLNQVLGPKANVREIQKSLTQSRKIADAKMADILEALQAGNPDSRAVFSEAASEIMQAWGYPRDLLSHLDFSFDQIVQLNRAFRATLACLILNNEHPLVLITRASKGDRRAVLDLVRADNLFVTDRCCRLVIRKAFLQDDVNFIAQLRRAMGCWPKLRRRDTMRMYLFILFLFEHWGMHLPTLNELWSTLDPFGSEYESLSAFERDFQRRRTDFNEILVSGEKEVPGATFRRRDSGDPRPAIKGDALLQSRPAHD